MRKGLYKQVKFVPMIEELMQNEININELIERMEDENWVLDDCHLVNTDHGLIANLIFVILWDNE